MMSKNGVKLKGGTKQNIEPLLERLKDISTVEDNNQVGFNMAEYPVIEWAFLSILDFANILNYQTKTQILEKTFSVLVANKRFEKEYFFEQVEINIKEYYGIKKEEPYFLLTELSISELPFRKIVIGESTITIHGKKFPKEFDRHRNTFLHSNTNNLRSNGFIKVSISVKSRDFKEGYEKCFHFLEIFRSLFCLVLNSQIEIRFGDKMASPINKIRHGSILTLHDQKGNLANKNYYWYIQDYKKPDLLKLNNKEKADVKVSIGQLISSYNKCKPKHQESLGLALKNYAGAFDESNKQICFLKSWTVLELLSNTDVNDVLIKRCSAMFGLRHRPFQKQILESLREYRNEYVHKGDNGINPLTACFIIQDFIYRLIADYNLKFAGLFKNIDEAVLFLDNYVLDLKELERKKKIISEVIHARKKLT